MHRLLSAVECGPGTLAILLIDYPPICKCPIELSKLLTLIELLVIPILLFGLGGAKCLGILGAVSRLPFPG